MRRTPGLVVAFAAGLLAVAVPGLGAAQAASASVSNYIVVLEPGPASAAAVAERLADRYGGEVGFVYRHALRGFSIRTTDRAAEAMASNPNVVYVEADGAASVAAEQPPQSTPTGIGRIYAAPAGSTGSVAEGSPYNVNLDIDSSDDKRVDVDIAIIDTGIDLDHPDLNVVGGTNCLRQSSWQTCSGTGDDDHYHGTHVAGTAAALDNGFGVVGVAPGARLWAVKVLDRRGSGTWSGVIAGVDWVAAHAATIEVANMSLGGGRSQAVNDAVRSAVEGDVTTGRRGVNVVVAAGNSSADVENYSPASEPTAITVSALADFNGHAGGLAAPTCRSDADDTFANFSNYGADTTENSVNDPAVDMIAPGVCILSTYPNGEYNTISGTSMASPHVAGAAALLRSMGKAAEAAEIDLMSVDNKDWNDSDDPDRVQEELLDVSNPTLFAPMFVTTGGSTPTNSPPTASFTSSCTDLSCGFTDTSTDTGGTIVSRSWTFGDGTSSTEANPSHTYLDAGTYTVTLTVTDNDGATGVTSQSVTVTAPSGGTTTPTFVGSSTKNGKNAWKATISVSGAVPGASVTGTWDTDDPGGCTADSTGACSFSLAKISTSDPSVTWTYWADGTQVPVSAPG